MAQVFKVRRRGFPRKHPVDPRQALQLNRIEMVRRVAHAPRKLLGADERRRRIAMHVLFMGRSWEGEVDNFF